MSQAGDRADVYLDLWTGSIRQEGDRSHKSFKHDILRAFIAISSIDIRAEGCHSFAGTQMLKRQTFAIADIYVPVKRRTTLNPATVRKIAESILEVGLQSPILLRRDGERFVLVEGLHRLEACKELGEQTIAAFLVQARRH